MDRFDDYVRTERYFTATLLPLVLFHDDFAGLRAFAELVESRVGSEHDGRGTMRAKVTPDFDFSDPEVITEFHIARDLHHYGARLAGSDAEASVEDGVEKRDAPDLVLVLGREVIVVEAKFFVGFTASGLQAQLRSQKRQVRHLFESRPSLRAWRHVALVPEALEGLDCDGVITWDDVAELSCTLLGPSHYVSRRFMNAVARYPRATGVSVAQNYESKLSLAGALERCRLEGNAVWIGHTGGEADLRMRGVAYALAKQWKWRRADTGGAIGRANWISGTRFAALIASLDDTDLSAPAEAGRARNYDGVLDYDDMVALCHERGRGIQVGHTGGEGELAKRGLAYARGRRWKWRDPSANRGIATPANWIAGDRFATLAGRLR